ncbi:Rne/Rng family ribonuclease [Paenibacillus endoradicis]|uniref:Rne/Rng family ribonuclease n=1 Tax=Paenibacillus endoradicis TaxID=2972487 RepID=UPI002158E02A|nr:Rne/Rng family ribonuclease [Paenibacillus endoradicis]MCR8655712.1 Rne/Rng family ribonuclease [Paenibacillus endoradicis]MCR8658038.1 Rne/Rng family ribonuclease [Paenibacillus endoradicis]
MKQLLIHMNEAHTQAALLVDGQLTEFFVEQTTERSLVGNFYKGIVQNVLPGMQAAFVDIGIMKNAFIYIDDILDPNMDKQPREKPTISQVTYPGQELIVQVVKDPFGNKGARVTTHYNLAGRWLVYMPKADYIGISKKVVDEHEKERLKQIGTKLISNGEGIIMRTAAVGETVESLQADVDHLRHIWEHVADTSNKAQAPHLLHSEEQLLQRVFRDLYRSDVDEICVSSPELQEEVQLIMQLIAPQESPNIRSYVQQQHAIISQFGVHKQLVSAFGRKIPLNNGGYIIWEETEALTVIDVNTGKFVGHNNLEDTLYQTNAEAAQLIVRLLRLRDTGGIIIIDFIDMEYEENRNRIFKILFESVKFDGAKCVVFGWTRLGLMELTRKKARDSYTSKYLQEIQLK